MSKIINSENKEEIKKRLIEIAKQMSKLREDYFFLKAEREKDIELQSKAEAKLFSSSIMDNEQYNCLVYRNRCDFKIRLDNTLISRTSDELKSLNNESNELRIILSSLNNSNSSTLDELETLKIFKSFDMICYKDAESKYNSAKTDEEKKVYRGLMLLYEKRLKNEINVIIKLIRQLRDKKLKVKNKR